VNERFRHPQQACLSVIGLSHLHKRKVVEGLFKLWRHPRFIGPLPQDGFNRGVFQLTASDKTPIKSSAFKLFFEASLQSSDLFV